MVKRVNEFENRFKTSCLDSSKSIPKANEDIQLYEHIPGRVVTLMTNTAKSTSCWVMDRPYLPTHTFRSQFCHPGPVQECVSPCYVIYT
jgi:hypothetical protein